MKISMNVNKSRSQLTEYYRLLWVSVSEQSQMAVLSTATGLSGFGDLKIFT